MILDSFFSGGGELAVSLPAEEDDLAAGLVLLELVAGEVLGGGEGLVAMAALKKKALLDHFKYQFRRKFLSSRSKYSIFDLSCYRTSWRLVVGTWTASSICSPTSSSCSSTSSSTVSVLRLLSVLPWVTRLPEGG